MNVTVEVVGEESHDLEVEDATYADLLAEVDLSPHEVSVMVDGRPVPEDQPVEADHVKVLRLIKGGSDIGQESGGVAEFDRERRGLGVSKLDFELPNAGTGPDPLTLSDLADDSRNDALVLLFHRDYHCRNCRQQVEQVADRYGEFRERDAAVVSILPESRGKAEKWQGKYHLPFPLVADEEKSVAEQYGQPTRFGKLGKLFDLVGRMPQTVILDARDKIPGAQDEIPDAREGLRLYAVHRGDSPTDRPSVDDVLAMVDWMLAAEDRPLADER
jgi:peroxiredoxin Q/BCP